MLTEVKIIKNFLSPTYHKELLNSLYDILIPLVQEKEIQKNIYVIKTISAITDSKQVDIVKYIINNLDNNNNFTASYTEIMEEISISKPTLIKLFKDLAQKDILVKVAHKTYKFNQRALS